jgi:hypothetical protein
MELNKRHMQKFKLQHDNPCNVVLYPTHHIISRNGHVYFIVRNEGSK